MKKIKFTIGILFFFAFFISCSEDLTEENELVKEKAKSFNDLNFSQNDKLREKFGRALIKALHENEEVRKFIKDEAQKQFNKDYDVLYHLVKDKSVGGEYLRSSQNLNYNSFRSVLLTYFDNESELIQIENQLPLLTIFVPKLPENSFSAENWNTSNQLPAVAIRLDGENDVPIIFNKDLDFVFPAEFIPDFPVVVIKDNERVISNQMHGYASLETTILNTNSNLSYKYIDQNLDPNMIIADPDFVNISNPVDISNTNNNNSTNNSVDFNFIPGRDTTVAPFLIDAYNVFNGVVTNPWQRDNIYYGLTATNTTGILKNTYREAITYFKLEGTAQEVYNTLSQRSPGNNDPALHGNFISGAIHGFVSPPSPSAAWTEGSFEFWVYCTHGSKSDPDGTNTKRVFGASPADIFEITYTRVYLGYGLLGMGWRATLSNVVKPIDFYTPNGYNGQKLIFLDWDLSDFSNRWNFKFEEVDTPVTNEITESQSTKHNQNAEVNISGGEKTKFGLKFGASIENTTTSLRKWNWTTSGKNDLGIQSVHFKDNVVNKHPETNLYYPSIFNAGKVSFELRPIQTNF